MAYNMKSSLSQSIIITLCALLLIIIYSPQPCFATNNNNKIFKKLYAFGDSITDTGNTNSSTGPIFFTHVSNPPYGRTFFHHPTNRYSDGRLVIDFVAEALSLPLLPPYLDSMADKSYGINFAIAGCTAINYRFFERNNITLDITPKSLATQLRWFNKYLESVGCKDYKTTPKQCGDVFDDSLFWVGAIGVNDYAYVFGSSVTSHTIQQLAINRITGFLQALLKRGAKYVVVQGLHMAGCTTFNLYLAPQDDRDAMGCVATVNRQSYTHNAILQKNLQPIRQQFPRATIIYADYWNAYKSILTDHKSYGISEPFKACCGSRTEKLNFDLFATCGSPEAATSCPDPSRYINWDGGHLTEAMYKLVADKLLNGSFSHPPFSYLLKRKISSAH